MSFDLYVFDVDDLPDDEAAIGELLEDDAGWDEPLTARLAAFVAELAREYPDLETDPDQSPSASWPLEGNSVAYGSCCGFNIVWSAAEAMSGDMRSRAHRHGLTMYDPQTSEVIWPYQPAEPRGRRGLFRRRRDT